MQYEDLSQYESYSLGFLGTPYPNPSSRYSDVHLKVWSAHRVTRVGKTVQTVQASIDKVLMMTGSLRTSFLI